MSFKGPMDYSRWLWQRQEQSIPLEYYYPGVLDRGALPDSFRSDADEMIGSKLKVVYSSEVDDLKLSVKREVNGRILGRRYDAKIDRWEHLVAFKIDDREFSHWLCLREHPCYVGSEIVWTKNLQEKKHHKQKYDMHYMPMQRLLPSGLAHLCGMGVGFNDENMKVPKIAPDRFPVS